MRRSLPQLRLEDTEGHQQNLQDQEDSGEYRTRQNWFIYNLSIQKVISRVYKNRRILVSRELDITRQNWFTYNLSIQNTEGHQQSVQEQEDFGEYLTRQNWFIHNLRIQKITSKIYRNRRILVSRELDIKLRLDITGLLFIFQKVFYENISSYTKFISMLKKRVQSHNPYDYSFSNVRFRILPGGRKSSIWKWSP